MIRYLYGDELFRYPKLRDGMFRDRAIQFRTRLGWDVLVDENGHEKDDYDRINPIYVIWERKDGSHGGSLRFLPTVGQTMVNDHFKHLTDGVEIRHPLIWECTRFCLAEDTEVRVSAALLLAALEIGIGFHLDSAVGVFDKRMLRFYRRTGWSPTVVGDSGCGSNSICVGLWDFDPLVRDILSKRSGIVIELASHWFETAFQQKTRMEPAA